MEFPFLDPLRGGEVACEHRAGEGFLPNLRGLVSHCALGSRSVKPPWAKLPWEQSSVPGCGCERQRGFGKIPPVLANTL